MAAPALLRRCALVEVRGPDARGTKADGRAFFASEAGRTTLSASGVLCAVSGVPCAIVTSATLLAPFLDVEAGADTLLAGCRLRACLEPGLWVRCVLRGMHTACGVREAAETLLAAPLRVERGVHGGMLAVLEVLDAVPDAPHWGPPRQEPLRRGDSVRVCSSPFGMVAPAVFRNSLTAGVISNVLDGLLLSDARALPGSEGGAVVDAAGRLVGVVAGGLERRNGTGLELTPIIPLDTVREAIGLLVPEETPSETEPINGMGQPAHGRLRAALAKCERSVVLISVGSSWGSGVLVSPQGHVLSCAHLFRPFCVEDAATGRLRLREPRTYVDVELREESDPARARHRRAELLFCSRGPIDVALLQLQPATSTGATAPYVSLSEAPPRAGQACLALGHAIFDPSAGLTATASAGVVARVAAHPRDSRQPAILQTSASVFRGHSGGLLADDEGRLLGIITSNARHSDGKIIPTINFCVPLAAVRPLLATCVTHDEAVWDAYDREDPALLSLWRLEGHEEPNEPPGQGPGEDVVPGSRFNDFMQRFGSKL